MKFNMKALLGVLDVMPGMKTYMGFLTMLGMLMCQGFGYHVFSAESWGTVATATGIFFKMGMDRKDKV
jgi:hypothetical protein